MKSFDNNNLKSFNINIELFEYQLFFAFDFIIKKLILYIIELILKYLNIHFFTNRTIIMIVFIYFQFYLILFSSTLFSFSEII